jgi:hypothetical protein
MQRKMYMSSILISGCGITFCGQRPTWPKVLKLCGVSITDCSGPAISNYLILNSLLDAVYSGEQYSHVVCQLTTMKKLDVELHNKNMFLKEQDTIRNFEHHGYWPSSSSRDHEYKCIWEDYLYSPSLEQQDVLHKLLLLQTKCEQTQTPLLILPGYKIKWTHPLHQLINFADYIVYEEYKKDDTWNPEDHSEKNNVPIKSYQIKLAQWINQNFLHMHLPKLDKFNV